MPMPVTRDLLLGHIKPCSPTRHVVTRVVAGSTRAHERHRSNHSQQTGSTLESPHDRRERDTEGAGDRPDRGGSCDQIARPAHVLREYSELSPKGVRLRYTLS
jgi:hypothetical protein